MKAEERDVWDDDIFGTEDQWLALAERHLNADWNSDKPDGYLNAVKALVRDAFGTLGQPVGWRDAHDLTKAAQDVLAERQRQIEDEGWTPEHDDEHGDGSMATAAACYALGQSWVSGRSEAVSFWPWDAKWNKIGRDRRRNLVKAGALILAEIERLDRASKDGVLASDANTVPQHTPMVGKDEQ